MINTESLIQNHTCITRANFWNLS